jgi:sterol desaturase/sphingolipid hydroxylase (fatty acid hydroxylase superfamily)
MFDDTIQSAIQAATETLSRVVPVEARFIVAPMRRVLEYCAGPLIDQPGRFPWWGMVAALGIGWLVFLYSRIPPEHRRQGLAAFLFPRWIWRHPSTWVDAKVGCLNYVLFGGGALNVTWRFTTAFVASGVTIGLTALFGPRAVEQAWGVVPIFLFAMAFSMANDFGYFLFHWASHMFPPLWAIHKLHHSAEVMTPLTAARVHPLEKPIMGITIALTTGLLVGPLLYLYAGRTGVLPALGLDVFGTLFFLLGHHLHHSHVWVSFGPVLGRIIVSPAQHQVHHSSLPRHLDKNFAEHWAFWDWMFGTLYLPRQREELVLGLAGYTRQPHTGVIKAWFGPLLEAIRVSVRTGLTWTGALLRRRPAPPPRSSLSTELPP